MTTDQKIERLLAQVARLKQQAQAKVDAGFVQTSTGGKLWGYMVGRRQAAPTPVSAPAQTYYSYFASSCGRAVKTVKAAVVGAGSAAKAVVMGAASIAKQAATAVCWTMPNWAWKQVLRGGAAVADGLWVAADLLEEAIFMGFSVMLLLAAVMVIGYLIVVALTTTIGIAVVLGMLWVGMLNHLLNEDAHARRNAARPW